MGKLNRIRRVLRKWGYEDDVLLGIERHLAGFNGCGVRRDSRTGERKVYVTFGSDHGKLFREQILVLLKERKAELQKKRYDKYIKQYGKRSVLYL